MANLYGAWFDETNDFTETHKRIDSVHADFYPLYKNRVNSIEVLAELFVEECELDYPTLAGKIHINFPNVVSGIGRYTNDIMHYKLWHDVQLANRSKMVSHTIKWLTIYSPISTSLSRAEYHELSDDVRHFVLEINNNFIANVISYFLDFFCDGSPPDFSKYKKVFYLVDTGQFDAKTAALLFEAIV